MSRVSDSGRHHSGGTEGPLDRFRAAQARDADGKRRRAPLNWNAGSRGYIMLIFVVFALLSGGFLALTGLDRRGNRWLGLLALAGGVVLAVTVVRYLMRPVRQDPPTP